MRQWEGHVDACDSDGRCLSGSVALQEEPFVCLNPERLPEGEALGRCRRLASWVYVEDADAVYCRVIEAGSPVEAKLAGRFLSEGLFRPRGWTETC